MQFKRADQFSPGFDDSAAAGKNFDILLPISGNAIFSSSNAAEPPGGWKYDPASQKLTVSVEPNLWRPDLDSGHDITDTIQGFNISLASKNTGKDVEQNAFGAKVVVQHGQLTSIGVAMISDEARSGSVHFDAPFSRLTAMTTEPPDAARIDSKVLQLEIKGRVLPMTNGKTTMCGIDGATATLDQPTSVVEHYCVFNAAILSIAVVANGRTIASWDQTYKPLTVEEYEERRFKDIANRHKAPDQ